ncbi:MAG: (2Fe-2S) ferredoxin domain-containing protein, partial [Synechococcus sp.]|nr:(2Fe-2S) ferredoxin domain-containing protein [Synechococcus sp.]
MASPGPDAIQVSHHLLLCATPTKALCCPDPAVGAASWDTLKRPGGIVLRSKADCLRIGAEGPILLIWPDGVG